MVPTVRALVAGFPRAHLTWVIGSAAHALVEGLPGVEFLVIHKQGGMGELLRLRRELRRRKFDVLLAAQASFRANWLYQAIRAPVKIGFDRQRASDLHGWFVNQRIPFRREHLLDSFLSFAEAIGLPRPPVEWGLPLGSEDYAWADEQLGGAKGPWLAINPAASKAERNWLPDRYAAVLDQVVERHRCRVMFTGAERDRKFGETILAASRHRDSVKNLMGRTTPKHLAALLSRTLALLAPDTGPVHLATAVGTPVVGMYAVAPPQLSGPYQTPELVVNRFPEAVRKFLHRDPASVPWKTRVHHTGAMELITVDDVLEKLDRVLKQNSSRADKTESGISPR